MDDKAHHLAEGTWVALSVISALRASCASGVNSLVNGSTYEVSSEVSSPVPALMQSMIVAILLIVGV